MEVQALQGSVDGAREVPGGKVCRCSQVKDAALRADGQVVQEVLGECFGGLVEMSEEDNRAAFPAFVVSIQVNLGQFLEKSLSV